MKKLSKIFRCLLPALLIVAMVIPALPSMLVLASDTKYESYEINEDSFWEFFGANYCAQTFTPDTTHIVTSIKIKAYKVGSPGTITATILATSGGVPTGGALGTGTTDGNAFTTSSSGAWYEITITGSPLLDASTKYALQIRAADGSAGNTIKWLIDVTSPTYAGGNAVWYAGSWTPHADKDLLFIEYGVLPSPSATALDATSVTETGMTLNGTLDSMGGEATVDVRFQWGLTDAYGDNTSYVEMTVAEAITGVPISGLQSGTTYHYRVDVKYDTTEHAYSDDHTDDTTHEAGSAEFTKRVGAGTDDALKWSTNFDTSSVQTAAGNAGYVKDSGMRFLNVTVPKDAVITQAFLTFTAIYDDRPEASLMNIYGEDADNAVTFSTGPNFAGRVKTTAYTVWDAEEAWTAELTYDSPDLKDIVQEIVNRASWVSNNAMVFLWYDDGSTGSRDAYSYNGSTTKAPFLTIYYESDDPAFTTDAATLITTTTVTLNGEVTDFNEKSITQWGFEYGETTGYGTDALASGTMGLGSFSEPLTGLNDDTLYHFRAKMYDGADWYYASDRTFTTLTTGATGVWTAYNNGYPVMSSADAPGYAPQSPSVIYLDGTYYMFFEDAPDGTTYNNVNIGRATSTDGITWTFTGTVLTVGAGGQWDDGTVWDPSVVIDPDTDTWWMGYGGSRPNIVNVAHGIASSEDLGITWTKWASNPVQAGGQDPQLFYDPVTTKWRLYDVDRYRGDADTPEDLKAAASNSMSIAGADYFQPDVHYFEGTYVMFYGIWQGGQPAQNMNSVGMATSTDGKTGWARFTTEASVWSLGNDMSVINIDTNSYYMYHIKPGANDSSGVYISLATYTGSLLGVNAPNVITGSVTGTTTTSTTLQGTLASLGDYTPVYVSFEYGTTTSYGTSTTEETLTSISGYNTLVENLTSNTLYHYRAKVRYSVALVGYGTDQTFTTSEITVTPLLPTDFKVSAITLTSITLSWTKGTDAVTTVIRYSTSGYPSLPTDGDSAYSGTGITTTHSALTPDTRYYYSAWSLTGGTYSATYATTSGIPTSDILAVPDTFEIETLQIYKDYLQGHDGDQIIVFSYKILWNEGLPATLNPEDFFYFQILDGDVVKKQDRIKAWGYTPGSLYVSELSPLEWMKDYTFKIVGTSKFSTPPEITYAITSSNYMGNNYDYLTTWVIDRATSMQNSIYWDSLIEYSQTGYMLTTQGSQVFLSAIPGLDTRAPSLFYPTGEAPDYTAPDDSMPFSESSTERAEDSHGSVYWTAFENFAVMTGLEVEDVAWIFWTILYLVGIVTITAVSKSFGAGVLLALPILLIGTQFGGVPMAIIIAASIIGLGAFVYKGMLANA